MANLAYTILTGNLVKDPELRVIGENQKVAILVIAVNHSRKKDMVSYFTVEAWGKNAEVSKRVLKKGSRISLLGDLRQDRWTDNKGEIHSRTKILARQIHFDFRGKKRERHKDAA